MRVVLLMVLGSAFTIGCKLLGLVGFGWLVVLSPIWGMAAFVALAAVIHFTVSASENSPDRPELPSAPADLEPD